MSTDINAFVENGEFRIEGKTGGPLQDLTFVTKDLFDVAGRPTGGGNPDWGRQQPVPTKNSWAVQTLLDAGASLTGKTITDEISLGILGENIFYGTPLNSAAPDRVPGGSSSGSAAAVAAGLSDIGLGSDTGGSIRVPASFCGLYGIRPTYGRLDVSGLMPQAPTSDTPGWFARDAETFSRVSAAMLGEKIPSVAPKRLVIAVDAFGFAENETTAALRPFVDRLAAMADEVVEDIMAPQGLSVWGKAQRCLQMREAWETFQDWVDKTNPALAFNVARGLIMGSMQTDADLQYAAMMRREAKARLEYLLPPGSILVMPTTPFPAPEKGLPIHQQNPIRELILSLCAHGGLAGLPQVSIPGATVDGAPVGLSILAAKNEDAQLVGIANAMKEIMS